MGGLLSVLVRALDWRGAANKEAGMAGLVSLEALEGRWRLSRVIRDADGSEARLHGVAVFRREGDGFVQEEEGWLTLPGGGAPLRATRRYLWADGEGGLEVRFEDGRPFHTVQLGVERPEAAHECAPDVYRVAYDFGDWPRWRAVWRVTGPRKDYVMTSDYAPL
jgi:hypothetical protein